MAKTGRPRSCDCGECKKCLEREKSRARYQALSKEERQAMIARRDPEKVRSADRRRYWRNHEKRREVNAEYRRKHPDYFRETSAAWAARNPEKRQATWTLNNAVRDGKITKEPCEVCGEAKVEAHHDDYSKPLDVRWLCLAHHGQQHIVYRDEFEEVMAS